VKKRKKYNLKGTGILKCLLLSVRTILFRNVPSGILLTGNFHVTNGEELSMNV
jgi:hypothetical protein